MNTELAATVFKHASGVGSMRLKRSLKANNYQIDKKIIHLAFQCFNDRMVLHTAMLLVTPPLKRIVDPERIDSSCGELY